ncbi:MAG: lysine--tRNA ligase [Dehalococcoidia bacterium]|nr:lysine--tRNA ligase [Dehalococcoidia bacterium]
MRQRAEKLERLRARGVDPYPNRYKLSHTIAQALEWAESNLPATAPEATPGAAHEEGGALFTLAGRLIFSRHMGRATFAHIQDSTGRIQLHLRRDVLEDEYEGYLKDYDLGDIIGVSGPLFRTRTGEITVAVKSIAMLSKALRPPPEKWHGLADVEIRYRQRYLDLMSNPDARRIFATRSKIVSSMRRYLDSRDFLEVETPVLLPQAGGAAARPFVTHHNALDEEMYLRIATELYLKRLVVGGFDKVYEIGRIFRNEGTSTKHNPEFTMLECYQAYADYNDTMAMVEDMLPHIAQEVLGTTRVTYGGSEIDLTPPWRKIVLRDAILEHSGIDIMQYADADSLKAAMREHHITATPDEGWGKLVDHLQSEYVEPKLMQPTFLIDYPKELSPLAKGKPGDPKLVERFEAFIGGMEVANSFTELNDPAEQRERFTQQSRLREAGDEEAELPDEDFLVALEHGMPPTGGLGIGIDRLVMLLTDSTSIREVILFPQMRRRE